MLNTLNKKISFKKILSRIVTLKILTTKSVTIVIKEDKIERLKEI